MGTEIYDEWTIGNTERREDIRSYDFSVKVPAHSAVCAKAVVRQNFLNVRYTAEVFSPSTQQTTTMRGIWKGIAVGEIDQSFDPC